MAGDSAGKSHEGQNRRGPLGMALWRLRGVRDVFLLPRLLASRRDLARITDWPALIDRLCVEDGQGRKGQVFAFQYKSELLAMCRLLTQRPPKVVVEIGTAKGGTLYAWSRVMQPGGVLVSIDLPGGGGSVRAVHRQVYQTFGRGRGIRTHCLAVDSHSDRARALLGRILAGRKADFLFIDGDHSYEGVKADFHDYLPLVAPGGLIGLHDVAQRHLPGYCECDRFWSELKAGGRWEVQEFNDHPEHPFGIGVVRVPG